MWNTNNNNIQLTQSIPIKLFSWNIHVDDFLFLFFFFTTKRNRKNQISFELVSFPRLVNLAIDRLSTVSDWPNRFSRRNYSRQTMRNENDEWKPLTTFINGFTFQQTLYYLFMLSSIFCTPIKIFVNNSTTGKAEEK